MAVIIGDSRKNKLKGTSAADTLKGLANNDLLLGNAGADKLYGGTGNDRIDGGSGNDRLYGESGTDTLIGGKGADVIHGGSHNDKLYGGSQNDKLYGDNGNDLLDGGSGNDTLAGGAGNDKFVHSTGSDAYLGGSGAHDLVTFAAAGASIGIDLSLGTAHSLVPGAAAGDRFSGIEDVVGTKFGDFVIGNGSANTFYGGSGNDILKGGGGADRLYGGNDNDRMSGDSGVDQLWGGAGQDEFHYLAISDSGIGTGNRDRIMDFDQADDLIDLSGIDASAAPGFQGFTFIDTAAFDGTGSQLRWEQVDGNTIIQLEVEDDADDVVDMEIELVGLYTIAVDDFNL
ncbi:MAG: calcium-binding protein [Hyphomicrobiaceae bacterium]